MLKIRTMWLDNKTFKKISRAVLEIPSSNAVEPKCLHTYNLASSDFCYLDFFSHLIDVEMEG